MQNTSTGKFYEPLISDFFNYIFNYKNLQISQRSSSFTDALQKLDSSLRITRYASKDSYSTL